MGVIVLLAQNVGAQEKDFPTAIPTETPGVVKSPYPPYKLIDVEGFEPGILAVDPETGEVFRIPGGPPPSDPPPRGQDPQAEPKLPAHVDQFVRSFVAMGESNRPEIELPFYAHRVETYFGKSNMTHAGHPKGSKELRSTLA